MISGHSSYTFAMLSLRINAEHLTALLTLSFYAPHIFVGSLQTHCRLIESGSNPDFACEEPPWVEGGFLLEVARLPLLSGDVLRISALSSRSAALSNRITWSL